MKINAIFLGFLLLAAPAAAGDASDGAEKAAACVQCHGEAGNKPIANYPKLAGQREKYLYQVLKEYKSGARPNAVMAPLVAELSLRDLADLAAYFADQPGDLE